MERIFTLLAVLLVGAMPLQAQTNSWLVGGGGKWETGTNWLLGAPGAGETIFISNSPAKTVTIDATTSGSFSNTMSISNLYLGGPSATSNTLVLSNAGTNVPLNVTGRLEVSGAGELDVTDSALNVGLVWGLPLIITSSAGGTVNLYSGSVTLGGDVDIADLPVSSGTLNVHGGNFAIPLGSLYVGTGGPFAFGVVNVSGGTLSMLGSGMVLGLDGSGTFNMTGGSVASARVLVGNSSGSHGVMNISGGTFMTQQYINVGNSIGAGPSSLTISNGATVAVTNATQSAYVDVAGQGSLILDGGTLELDNLILTNGGTFTNFGGTLTYTGPFQVDNGSSMTVAGGTINAFTNFTVGSIGGSTSSVVVVDGSLIVTNAPLVLGSVGTGLLTISGTNSTVTAQVIKVGSSVAGASGTLAISSGTLHVGSLLSVNSTHSVDLQFDGYDILIDGTGATLNIGDDSPGAWNGNSSGATVNFANINVGKNPGCTGAFSQSAGQTFVSSVMTVGNCVTNGVETVGNVVLSGGALYVTNSTHTGTLVVRNGSFSLSPGAILVVDKLVLTNACAQFVNNGGTLSYGTVQLDPNIDSDGDGISNAAEKLAGTDPLNPNSYFHLTQAKRNGKDAVLSWSSAPGKSYYVQACKNPGQLSGSHFATVSPLVPADTSGSGITSYTVSNGATNAAVFYRVMLAP